MALLTINYYLSITYMRYFIELAYNGTRFCGWQRQPNAPSVQAHIENALSLILRQPIEIIGCGRTDTGVHASTYFAHFDCDTDFPSLFLERLNKLVGQDIILKNIFPVSPEAHARFDATLRSYTYFISFEKNPFAQETAWHFPHRKRLTINDIQKAAEILRGYSDFAPFCKTHSDAQTMACQISRAEWIFDAKSAEFHISANRFLRGMVRLIVGACLNVGLGQMRLEELKAAMDAQTPLPRPLSVPAAGLFLTEVKYDFL